MVMIIMGLFDKRREQKEFNNKAEWKQGLIPTIVELNDDHMKLITQAYTDTVFYTDIMFIEHVTRVVNFRTNVKKFSLIYKNRKGGGEKAAELHSQIMAKMSENK